MSKIAVQNVVNRIIAEGRPKLQTFLKYAKVELTPPSPTEIPQIKNDLVKLVSAGKNGRWKQVTVKEAWLNTLVTIEVLCWFYVGECIGKRHIVGYNV